MIELDSPGEVRKSEALNNLNLSFYLKKKLGSSRRPLVIKQFKKGFSNLTYSIIWDKNEYVLRKPPFVANIKSGHDMRREYNVLSNLSKYYNKVPKTYFFEDDKNVLGSSFYVMQRLNGIILRPNTPESSMPDKKDISKLSKNFIKIHKILQFMGIKIFLLLFFLFKKRKISFKFVGCLFVTINLLFLYLLLIPNLAKFEPN